jgi:CheY-like chemotaxis protein
MADTKPPPTVGTQELLASLGHELRNPLAAICSSMRVIRRLSGPDAPSATAQDVLERQVTHLVELVDSFLDADHVPCHGSELVAIPPVATQAQSVTLRILIVDDNEDAADMLATVLELGGHEVHAVHDGAAAVDAAASLDPDVVLLDIGLPTLNGYEVAQRIRAHEGDRHAVIIALTGWGQDADKRRAAESGCDAHWVKPVDEQKLERLLEDVRLSLAASKGPDAGR